MRDRGHVARVARAARDAVLSVPALRASHHAASLIEQIRQGAGAKRLQASAAAEIKQAVDRYATEVAARSEAFWQRRRQRQRLRDVAVSMGARKIKRWLSPPR